VFRDGWVVDVATGATLCKLPDYLSNACYASHKRSLAIGTDGGQVLLIHFPPALLRSPDTCPDGDKGRSLDISDEDSDFYEEDESMYEEVE
jgi:hypothetical protein